MATGTAPSRPAAPPAPPGGVLRWLLQVPAVLYRVGLGWLLGHRFMLLVHRGRRSGRRYETVLEVVRHDAATGEAVVVAGWGRRTAWLHNVDAGGAIEVRIGRQRFAPAVRHLPPAEAEEVVAGYERANRFIGPIVRLVLSRLLGWRYDGSPPARRRLVEQLPLIGIRPRGAGSTG